MDQNGPKQAKMDHGEGGVSNNHKRMNCKALAWHRWFFLDSWYDVGMKTILILSLVALAGCQDLGDYPDTQQTTVTQEVSRQTDSVPLGGRTITGKRDLSCFAGEPVEFRIQITPPPGDFVAWSPAPAGMYFDSYRQYNTANDGWFVILSGSPKSAGKYQLSIDLSSDSGISRSWFTLTVSEATRQSVAQ